MKVACLLLAPFMLLAQDPAALFSKAPPDIDEALRARVTKFYQAHVEGKFRVADELVAEDSKDIFFGMDKPRCRSFALGPITYSENFTRARVMISCDTEMVMVMMGRIPVKMPILSLWKMIDGQWFWYAEPQVDREARTPFGLHKPQDPSAQPAAPGPAGGGLSSYFVDLEAASRLVKIDREEVHFNRDTAGSERLTITNSMPGFVKLSLQGGIIPGVAAKLDKEELKSGESATLTISYSPMKDSPPQDNTLTVVADPINKEFTVRIRFMQPEPATAR